MLSPNLFRPSPSSESELFSGQKACAVGSSQLKVGAIFAAGDKVRG